MNKPTKTTENRLYRLILLLLPFALFFFSVLLSVLWFNQYVLNASPLFRLIVNSPPSSGDITDDTNDTGYIIIPPEMDPPRTVYITEPDVTEPDVTEPATSDGDETEAATETEAAGEASEKKQRKIGIRPAADFPVIRYQEQWATLNAENWQTKNIPVYFGDTDKILSKGAGMQFSSRFCGQNGKCVISAHVTSHFYEIEDVEPGDEITVDTVYGHYIYTVDEIVIFNHTDSELLMPDEGNSSLVMYTCYPREDGLAFKEKRIALICSMLEGVLWIGK